MRSLVKLLQPSLSRFKVHIGDETQLCAHVASDLHTLEYRLNTTEDLLVQNLTDDLKWSTEIAKTFNEIGINSTIKFFYTYSEKDVSYLKRLWLCYFSVQNWLDGSTEEGTISWGLPNRNQGKRFLFEAETEGWKDLG